MSGTNRSPPRRRLPRSRSTSIGQTLARRTRSCSRSHREGDALQRTRLFSGDLPATGTVVGQPIDPTAAPIEMLVQREQYSHAASVDIRFAADVGRYFVRVLEAHGIRRYAAGFVKLYPIEAPPGLNAESARFAGSMAGRAIDGAKLYRAILAGHPATPTINANDQELIDSAMQ